LIFSGIIYLSIFFYSTYLLIPVKSYDDIYKREYEMENRSEVELLLNKNLIDE